MNKRESFDVESAYGSEISTNSGYLMKKETFTMEESSLKNYTWYQWLKYKLREHMILEAIFFLVLVFLLIACYRITSQNQETQAMILNLQSQFNSFQKQTTGKNFMDSNKETEKVIENENEKMKEMLGEVLKEVRMKSVIQAESTQPVINYTKNSETTNIPPKTTATFSNPTITRFNAASLIAGATVDTSRSSSSNLNPFFGYDQSSMVLVDRPEPPANKAWCTHEKEPILTVNLAKYVKPTAVSYQHWNGTSLDDAPKTYDVLRCLDYSCEKLEPLVLNCEYKEFKHESGKQEQHCEVPTNSINTTVGKVQFRFRKNHGNSERTCVSLVRVYADPAEAPKEEERTLYDAEQCSDLKNDYHNNYLTYNYWDFKTCKRLFSMACCDECPECCQECSIKEWNRLDSMFMLFLSPFWLPILALILLLVLFCVYEIITRIYSKLSSFF